MNISGNLLRSLLLMSVFVVSACSDNEADVYEHLYNPLWSPLGNTIVAGYAAGSGGGLTAPAPGSTNTQLLVADVDTLNRKVIIHNRRIIDLPDLQTIHSLYEFDPTGSVLMFPQNGRLTFVDLNGRVRAHYNTADGLALAAARFVPSDASIVLVAGLRNGQFEVHRLVFDPNDWRIMDDSLLLSRPAPGDVISITPAGREAFVLRFATGEIRHYANNGALLHTYETTHFASVNPWHHRLMYFHRQPANPGIYVLEHKAISFLDLVTGDKRVLVTGDVVDMDVNDRRNSMAYETYTGDIWLSSTSGVPLTRISPQNIMPRFSMDGLALASVERMSPRLDTLKVLRFQ
jgi:hypothetical protein